MSQPDASTLGIRKGLKNRRKFSLFADALVGQLGAPCYPRPGRRKNTVRKGVREESSKQDCSLGLCVGKHIWKAVSKERNRRQV